MSLVAQLVVGVTSYTRSDWTKGGAGRLIATERYGNTSISDS